MLKDVECQAVHGNAFAFITESSMLTHRYFLAGSIRALRGYTPAIQWDFLEHSLAMTSSI